jgi:hypothetical protein
MELGGVESRELLAIIEEIEMASLRMVIMIIRGTYNIRDASEHT